MFVSLFPGALHPRPLYADSVTNNGSRSSSQQLFQPSTDRQLFHARETRLWALGRCTAENQQVNTQNIDASMLRTHIHTLLSCFWQIQNTYPRTKPLAVLCHILMLASASKDILLMIARNLCLAICDADPYRPTSPTTQLGKRTKHVITEQTTNQTGRKADTDKIR